MEGVSMWLKIDTVMPNHPKTVRLAASLGMSRRECVGFLVDFFSWARNYAPTGYLAEWTDKDICPALGLPDIKLLSILEETKWMNQGWIKNWPSFGGAEIAEKAKREPEAFKEMIEFYSIIPYGEIPVKKREKYGLEEKRRDKKREEKKDTIAPEMEAAFASWYATYPRKQKREDALKAWVDLNPDASLQALMKSVIPAQIQGHEWWKDDKKQFIPLPATWIRNKRWTDQFQQVRQESNREYNSMEDLLK